MQNNKCYNRDFDLEQVLCLVGLQSLHISRNVWGFDKVEILQKVISSFSANVLSRFVKTFRFRKSKSLFFMTRLYHNQVFLSRHFEKNTRKLLWKNPPKTFHVSLKKRHLLKKRFCVLSISCLQTNFCVSRFLNIFNSEFVINTWRSKLWHLRWLPEILRISLKAENRWFVDYRVIWRKLRKCHNFINYVKGLIHCWKRNKKSDFFISAILLLCHKQFLAIVFDINYISNF